jgi:uncharacterized RDD family membrane protein YckC
VARGSTGSSRTSTSTRPSRSTSPCGAGAAYLLVDGRGVIGGYAAAELLDASCGPEDAPVDLVLPGRAYREHPGLVVHRGLLLPDETTAVDGIAATSPVRTAYDLGRNPR